MGVDFTAVMNTDLHLMSEEKLEEYLNINLRCHFPVLDDVDSTRLHEAKWTLYKEDWAILCDLSLGKRDLISSAILPEGAFYYSGSYRWLAFLDNKDVRTAECDTSRILGRAVHADRIIYYPDETDLVGIFDDAANFEGFLKILHEKSTHY